MNLSEYANNLSGKKIENYKRYYPNSVKKLIGEISNSKRD